MKRLLSIALVCAFLILLSGCNSFEIHGIENFSENDCIFGLNSGLLPGDRDFLLAYPYLSGNYHYWRNNYGWAKARTYVQLQYSEKTYVNAKKACLDYFNLASDNTYQYAGIEFQKVSIGTNSTFQDPVISDWFWMLGIDDKSCSLVFLGYLNQDKNDETKDLVTSDFAKFFEEQFGRCFA